MKIRSLLKDFTAREDGYVFVLTLLFLPVLFGMAVLIIDVGRGNNAHSDLYAATDALALAGALELDGSDDAICDAKDAMENLTNTVSLLAATGDDTTIELVYEDTDDNAYTVVFLSEIPEDDDDPIDFSKAVVDTDCTNGESAEYVYVRGEAKPGLKIIFFNPANMFSDTVPVQTVSVATRKSAACKIPPIFMCNPFEGVSSYGPGAQGIYDAWSAGEFYGRLVRLHPKGSDTAGPGNFSLLAVGSNPGAKELQEFIANPNPPVCVDSSGVQTKPGATTSVRFGFNVLFDMYDGSFADGPTNNPNKVFYPPAPNVRKGYTYAGNACNASLQDPPTTVMGFPENDDMYAPNGTPGTVGAFIGQTYEWDLDDYWATNYWGADKVQGGAEPDVPDLNDLAAVGIIPPIDVTLPAGMATTPSRYEIYRYEIAAGLTAVASPGGEVGTPQCGDVTGMTLNPERRVLPIAILDCLEQEAEGNLNGSKIADVAAWGEIFLTNPMVKAPPPCSENPNDVENDTCDSTVNIELVEIIAPAAGTTATVPWLRPEVFLVR